MEAGAADHRAAAGRSSCRSAAWRHWRRSTWRRMSAITRRGVAARRKGAIRMTRHAHHFILNTNVNPFYAVQACSNHRLGEAKKARAPMRRDRWMIRRGPSRSQSPCACLCPACAWMTLTCDWCDGSLSRFPSRPCTRDRSSFPQAHQRRMLHRIKQLGRVQVVWRAHSYVNTNA